MESTSPNFFLSVKQDFKKGYHHFKEGWSYVGPSIGIGRKFVQAAKNANEVFFQKGLPEISQKINFFVDASKLFSVISIFFSILGMKETGKKIQKAVEIRDAEGVVLESFKQTSSIASLFEKIINVAKGTTGAIKGLEHILPKGTKIPIHIGPKVAKTVSILGKFDGPLNALMALIGIITGSMKMDTIRNSLKEMKQLEKISDNQPVLFELLQHKIGISSKEEGELVGLVQKVAQKRIAEQKEPLTFEQEDELFTKLKERKIEQKKASFCRASSLKSYQAMQTMMEKIKEEKPLSQEETKRIFQEIKTVLHRKIIYQSIGLATSILGLTSVGLLYTPIAPFIPYLIIGSIQLTGLIVGTLEKKYLEKGLFKEEAA